MNLMDLCVENGPYMKKYVIAAQAMVMNGSQAQFTEILGKDFKLTGGDMVFKDDSFLKSIVDGTTKYMDKRYSSVIWFSSV